MHLLQRLMERNNGTICLVLPDIGLLTIYYFLTLANLWGANRKNQKYAKVEELTTPVPWTATSKHGVFSL